MKYSQYQEAIFKAVKDGMRSILVNAVAGSGKTTTIVEIAKQLVGFNCAFVAFNKHIADELKTRLSSMPFVGTTHSLGLKAVKRAYPRARVDVRKVWNMIQEHYLFQNKQGKINAFATCKLLSLVRNTLANYEDVDALRELCAKYDITFAKVGESKQDREDITDSILSAIPSFMDEIIQSSKYVIDFDDMLFLPAMGLVECQKFDIVLVDEVQDYNRAQVLLTQKSVKEGGRVIAVGDKRQAIYGFRGADSNSFTYLKDTFNAIELPLSISYRCPKAHVSLASSIVPEIEAAETAKDGEVINLAGDDLHKELPDNALVIARRNAPLIPYALKLLKAGRKAVVKGKDLGKNLIQLIESFDAKDVCDLLAKVDAWRVQEMAKYQGKPDMQDTIADKASVIEAFCQDVASVADVIQRIDSLFNDEERKAITLSTIHRAKGLEADYVAILEPGKLKTSEAGIEELNCTYVAYTRSKRTLAMVS